MLPYAKLARLLMPIQELPLGAQLIFSGKETAMTPGTIIELEVDGPKNKWTAKVGARATVVDGKKRFPELHDQLEEYLRNFGSLDKDIEEFIFVVWDRNDPRWNKQPDGAYTKYRFREVGKGPEPKNNDGRTVCFWCNGPTEIRQGFTSSYNICPKCKR
jgi:hypothetical protein